MISPCSLFGLDVITGLLGGERLIAGDGREIGDDRMVGGEAVEEEGLGLAQKRRQRMMANENTSDRSSYIAP